MIKFTDSKGNTKDVDILEILPLTHKEIIYQALGGTIQQVLMKKGIRFRFSISSIILVRRLPVSKKIKLAVNNFQSKKHHKLQYITFEKKVSFIIKHGEVDELETSLIIAQKANELIKETMIVSRKIKAIKLQSEIKNLESK